MVRACWPVDKELSIGAPNDDPVTADRQARLSDVDLAMKIIEKHEKDLSSKTYGVFTQCDQLSEGLAQDLKDRVLSPSAPGARQLANGWVATANKALKSPPADKKQEFPHDSTKGAGRGMPFHSAFERLVGCGTCRAWRSCVTVDQSLCDQRFRV